MLRIAVIVFAYNRPLHTARCLDSLLQADGIEGMDLWVRADGPKPDASMEALRAIEETRLVIQESVSKHVASLVAYDTNIGVEAIIYQNITAALQSFDAVIVVEDDLIVSTAFLRYMRSALTLYMDDPEVFSVSAYMWPGDHSNLGTSFFMPVPHYWGWGTWGRAWKHYVPDARRLAELLKAKGRVEYWNSFSAYRYSNFELLELHAARVFELWDILWSGSVVLNEGLTLYPAQSLVRNCGFDNTGLHCRSDIGYDFASQPLSNIAPELERQALHALPEARQIHEGVRRLLTASRER